MKVFVALAAAALASFAYAAPTRGTLHCTTVSTRALKWMKGWNPDLPHGYLSFTNEKDEQGRPMATALERDGSPAKPVKFHYQTCAAPHGTPGYMGYGTGRHETGVREGHFQLASDPSKCLTLTGTQGKNIRLVLDQCQYSDSKVQETQFFGVWENALAAIALHPANYTGHKVYKYRVSQEGAHPFVIDSVTQDYVTTEYYLHWESFPQHVSSSTATATK